MSERKVLNKYYPPDFDPSKIPRPKIKRDGKFGIRLMAPFNMRCNTCGEYIYKGKKFNSRKEDAAGENYLGLHIFRFYIKCPRCVAEIAFKTDPENTDYILEAGATRNFEALRTAERLAKQELDEQIEEEKNNPMKLLENRTKASLQEMDMIETLEELRDLRQKQNCVSLETIIEDNVKAGIEDEEQRKKREEEEDEHFVQSLFGPGGSKVVKRVADDYNDDDDRDMTTGKKQLKLAAKPTQTVVEDKSKNLTSASTQKQLLSGIVRKGGKSIPQKAASAVSPSAAAKKAETTKLEDKSAIKSLQITAASTAIIGSNVAATSVTKETNKVSNGLFGLMNYASSSDQSDSDES